jgi:hypothetical protein
MNFHKNKKNLAVVGAMIILFSASFLMVPKKAEAIVPVVDAKAVALLVDIAAATDDTAVNTGIVAESYREKEYVLDTIAYAIAKQILHALSQSIVNWIKSGFQGNPLFITNFEDFMRDQADQATGLFMKEFLSPEVYNAICSPWRIQLEIALKRTYTYSERMACTLSSVIKNAEDFSRQVHEGDWDTWINVTSNPQNNPFGALILSSDQLSALIAAATGNAKTESIFNAGFLGMKECVEQVDNIWTGETTCVKYDTVSPGTWVSDTLSNATGVDFQSLAMADELDEIISALITQLLTGILER